MIPEPADPRPQSKLVVDTRRRRSVGVRLSLQGGETELDALMFA